MGVAFANEIIFQELIATGGGGNLLFSSFCGAAQCAVSASRFRDFCNGVGSLLGPFVYSRAVRAKISSRMRRPLRSALLSWRLLRLFVFASVSA
jgi:hypothetical protein